VILITIHNIPSHYLAEKTSNMKKLELFVENIKCGGCMTSIKKGILELNGVSQVAIVLEDEKITIEGDHLNRKAITKKLDGMGYPEKGNNTLFKEAKSYVSCAIGKMGA
jgi:copper chaperone CopZ